MAQSKRRLKPVDKFLTANLNCFDCQCFGIRAFRTICFAIHSLVLPLQNGVDGQLITENYVLPKPAPEDRRPDIITVIIRPASLFFLFACVH